MKRNFSLILVVAIFAHSTTTFTKNENDVLTKFLASQYEDLELMNERLPFFKQFILEALPAKQMKAKEISGYGSYGLVLIVETEVQERPKAALKIVEQDPENGCPDNTLLNDLNKVENLPVIKYFGSFEHTITIEGKSLTMCAALMEAGVCNLHEPIFNSKNTNKQRNTRILGHIFRQLVAGFSIFNFKLGLLHADIKPKNLVLVFSPEYGFEIRIIDFDLTFNPTLNERRYGVRATEDVRYTLDQRPPEMRFFCPNTNCDNLETDDQQGPTRNAYFFWYFRYTEDYKEDAYALGVTLKEILDKNSDFVDLNDPFIKFFNNDVINRLSWPFVGKRQTTEEATELTEATIETLQYNFNISEFEYQPLLESDNPMDRKDLPLIDLIQEADLVRLKLIIVALESERQIEEDNEHNLSIDWKPEMKAQRNIDYDENASQKIINGASGSQISIALQTNKDINSPSLNFDDYHFKEIKDKFKKSGNKKRPSIEINEEPYEEKISIPGNNQKKIADLKSSTSSFNLLKSPGQVNNVDPKKLNAVKNFIIKKNQQGSKYNHGSKVEQKIPETKVSQSHLRRRNLKAKDPTTTNFALKKHKPTKSKEILVDPYKLELPQVNNFIVRGVGATKSKRQVLEKANKPLAPGYDNGQFDINKAKKSSTIGNGNTTNQFKGQVFKI